MGVFVGVLRGTAPTLAEEALGRISFRAVREGMVLFAFNARSGPFPLPPACGRVGWLLGQRSFGERFLGSWGLAGLG